MKVAVFVGTRPEIVKMQPVIKELKSRRNIETILVDTGQHYDYKLARMFFHDLGLPEPDHTLAVGSSSQNDQISKIMVRAEAVLRQEEPDVVVVEGDTNSALAASLTAAKTSVPVAHVEAGCRSHDRGMPEELNRILLADLADLHFAPTRTCVQNLLTEGIAKKKIFLAGHPLVDLVSELDPKITADILKPMGLEHRQYYLLTLHRYENIENRERLSTLLAGLSKLAKSREIVFPIHPHTKSCLKAFGMEDQLRKFSTMEPVGYHAALALVKFSKLVLTDSGGIQQEAALLGTPCVTLRTTTEWIETVRLKINFLLSHFHPDVVVKTIHGVESEIDDIRRRLTRSKNIFGKPGVSKRISEILWHYHGRLKK